MQDGVQKSLYTVGSGTNDIITTMKVKESSSLYKKRAHLTSTFSYVTKMSCIPLYLYKEFHRNWAETRGRSKKIASPFLMLLLAKRPLPWNKNNAPLVLCTLFTSLLKTEQAWLLLNPPASS